MDCDDIGLLTALVAQSDVLGILPSAMFQREPAALRRLAYAGGSLPVANVHAIWLKGRTLSPAAARAIALCKQVGVVQAAAAAA
jgi:DNA-binding transcriptional LysR family regulator